MALDGPYTIDDLLRMTGHRSRKIPQRPLLSRSGPAMLRIIGIDPGTRIVGYGVIDHDTRNNGITWVEHGTLEPSPSLPLHERLAFIFEGLEEVLRRTKPHAAALEETFAGINMKSAIAMGEGRGVALLALSRAKLDIAELSPRSIKKAVTGSGAAGKEHVAAMVGATLGRRFTGRADVTDALAAAIALTRRM